MSFPIFNVDELMKQRLLKVDSKQTYVEEIKSSYAIFREEVEDLLEDQHMAWNVSEEEYRAVFNSICTFLSGDHKKLIDSFIDGIGDENE